MAGDTAIAACITMALTYCRKHDRHEVEAAIAMWAPVFKDTDAEDLKAAVVQWGASLDEDQFQNGRLPLPTTLERIMGKGREVIADPLPERPASPIRPEFMAAHREARRRIAALVGGGIGKSLEDQLRAEPTPRPTKHEHQEPTYAEDGQIVTYGNEECRACNADALAERDRAERRAKVQAILDDLPEPEVDEEDRRNWSGCRCDGSGMIDTKASQAAMLGADLPREVYPCPQCNADLFGRWQRGEMSKAS